MYLIIDNYDSFVYTIAAYLQEAGKSVRVYRCDQISLQEIAALQPQGIILSPGPKHPADAKESRLVFQTFVGRIPILGICLGMQLIAHMAGAVVSRGAAPMHGKLSRITHTGTGLFFRLPPAFRVTRYHSLVVQKETLPTAYQCDAFSEDGVLMALHHATLPVWGVQFHPEALCTEYGHELLQNYCNLAEQFTFSETGDLP